MTKNTIDPKVYDLFDEYCHTQMTRRDFLNKASALAVVSGSGLVMAKALLPRYAEAQTISFTDERIWIASPYFVPDLQILSALKLAALRGVDVRILLPEKADHRTVYLASFAYYQNTLPLGIKIYRYTAGFMHQKVLLTDSSCAAVGTANLDNRSFRLNFEITLLNYDASFVKEIEAMLSTDFARSRPVTLEDYTGKSFFFKLAVRSARLLAPIL